MTIVYIVREDSSPCENLTFAAFSTEAKAEAFIDKWWPKHFSSRDCLWVEAHELDTATAE